MTSLMPSDSNVVFLDDRYELGDLIGEGAVGCVFAAHDKVLGIDVAIKIMHDQHASSPVMLERFASEAALSARMLSPHVVKVLGLAIAANGSPCIVYEKLEGESLASYLDRMGPLSVEETNEIIKQVGRALARVHALGIVHRDVKPDNIFITTQPDGHALIKLLDFGVAEPLKRKDEPRDIVGTPEYMAPEILFGSEAIDARVDLYSLGVVAFECLVGKCPFAGTRISEIFAAVQKGGRKTVGELRTDVSPEMDEFIDCALQPDPYWRYPSAKAMVKALEEATSASKRHSMRVAAKKAA